ncbi:putative LysR family transcriptional regulator [Streptomyces sp. Tu6071]|nr:putative LysR family transcriptional regulator [Streptomyces sp. Tu6071]
MRSGGPSRARRAPCRARPGAEGVVAVREERGEGRGGGGVPGDEGEHAPYRRAVQPQRAQARHTLHHRGGEHGGPEAARGEVQNGPRRVRLHRDGGHEAVFGAGRVQARADARAVRQAQEGVREERVERHGITCCQRVFGRYGDGERFVHDLARRQVRGGPAHGADQREVDRALAHARGETVRVVLHEPQRDPGVRAVEGGERGEEGLDGAGHDHADDETPPYQGVEFVDRRAQPALRREHLPRVPPHHLPRLREPHRAGRAVEEHGAQLPLQLRYLRADPGLADVQARGGARESALVGDGEEVPQVTQLHKYG